MMSRGTLVSACLPLAALAAMALGAPAAMADYNVTNTADGAKNVAGAQCETASAGCTLRAAVQASNAIQDAGVIDLQRGKVYDLSIAGRDEDASATGDLDILTPVTIRAVGTGADPIVDATGIDRVIDVVSNGALTLNHVTLRGGVADATPGTNGTGGGLFVDNSANASLNQSVISGNSAVEGGGIGTLFSSNVTLTGTEVAGNTASAGGGGIGGGGILSLVRSLLDGNTATTSGGGIDDPSGSLSISASTITGSGGANVVGAALHTGAQTTLKLFNSTIAHNNDTGPGGSVVMGGGLYDPIGSIVLGHCQYLGSSAPGNGSGNRFDDGSCRTAVMPTLSDAVVTDASLKLGPLADNGGSTKTLLPGAGSSALDAVPVTSCVAGSRDQRDLLRPAGPMCDAGAVEVGARADAGITLTGPAAGVTANGRYKATYHATISTHAVTGGDPFADPVVTLKVPIGATVDQATVSGGTCTTTTSPVVCSLSFMAPSTTKSLTYVVGLKAGTRIVDAHVRLGLAGGAQDSTPADNLASVTTHVTNPPLAALTKLSLTRTSFRAEPPGKRVPTGGTKVKFTLSRASKVQIKIRTRSSGTLKQQFIVSRVKGSDSFRYYGNRINGYHGLKAGLYKLVATPYDGSRFGQSKFADFKILP
jgi:hypothetical protein